MVISLILMYVLNGICVILKVLWVCLLVLLNMLVNSFDVLLVIKCCLVNFGVELIRFMILMMCLMWLRLLFRCVFSVVIRLMVMVCVVVLFCLVVMLVFSLLIYGLLFFLVMWLDRKIWLLVCVVMM